MKRVRFLEDARSRKQVIYALLLGMGRYIEAFQRTYKFAAILGGSEEIMADLGIRMAMKQMPKSRL
jgi:hypothetical protein